MTNQRELTDEEIQTAFRDVGAKEPTHDEIADARCFADSFVVAEDDSWSVDSSEFREWKATQKKPKPRRWVEDMLIPAGVDLGDLIEPVTDSSTT